MRKTISLLYKTFVRGFYLLITISTIFACSQNKPDQHSAIKKENTQKSSVTITAKAPFVTLLDTCPPPRTIAIPQKTADSYIIKTEDGSKTVQLLPPEIRSADFFVSMQNFTTRNGLTHNAVTKGYIDKNGNLWFGTYGGGVSRYDGKSFTNYTNVQGLASNYIWSICEDKAGNLWFGTWDHGVSRYDGRSFTNYTADDGLANNNTVTSILEDKNGNLWFGTGGGVSRLNQDGSFTNYTTAEGLAGDNVSSIWQDKNGKFWFGTWEHGVSCYDGRSFINYTADDGLANNTVGSIFEDKDGNLWFGGGRGKISWLDSKKNLPGEKPNFMNYTIAEGLSDVHNIAEDKNGNLWFGTGEGAFRLNWDKKSNPDKESFMSVSTRQGLPNNNINSILEDKSGNLWFCTDDGGVSLVNRGLKILTSLTINETLLYSKVQSVLEDKTGNIWIGTLGEGALRLSRDGKSLSSYTTSQGLPNNVVVNIFEDKRGNFWFACEGAISRLDRDGKSLTNYTTDQGLSHNWVLNIFEDKRGNFWFGTFGGGVCRLSFIDKSITRYTTAQGLAHNVVWTIIEDKKGNLWFGTGGGVSRLNQDGSFTNYTTAEGLAGDNVSGILQDKSGNLWIGTWEAGVSRFDGKSFSSFNTTQGVSHNKVRDVVMDKKDMIWLGTEKGFTILKGFVQDTKGTLNPSGQRNLPASNELSNSELERNNFKPVFEIYNIKTGYPIEEITSNLVVTQEGIIWAGTGSHEKTIRFDYSSMHKNPNPPDVFIQSIKINNEVICWHDLSHYKEKTDTFAKTPNGIEEVTQFGKILDEDQRQAMRKKFSAIKFDSIAHFYPVPVNLLLPYEHNNITFDFTAIEPARPGSVRYQYMMEGYEKEWSPVSDKTNATYGNIHEGSYTFKLKAQSPDGVWSRPLTYTLKVLPPWYRTWWFIITAVGCLVTLFYLVIRWRLQQKFRLQLERSEKEKQLANLRHKTGELEMQALRAQMNPHFIFNCLSSINHFILKNESEMASDYLTKFSRLIRMVLNNSKNPLINLEEELEMLRLYLDLEKLRFNNSFDYSINFYNHFDIFSIFIPPLLLQPFAENAIWHGLMNKKGQGILEFAFELNNSLLNCYITDNGIGRKKAETLKSKSAEKQKSMGMQITAERLALFNNDNEQTIFNIEDMVDAEGQPAGTRVILKIRYKETMEKIS
jgi:ligand-binding sensor domain-containing protein